MRRLLPIALLLSACASGAPENPVLEGSLEDWERVSFETPNYAYARYFQSWVGSWYRTKIDVIDGVVVERSYEFGGSAQAVEQSWTETGAELGMHSNGHRVATMDELYTECSTDILTKDPTENEVVFVLDDLGLLKTCTYRSRNCADDCVTGISIESLEFFTE